MVLTPDRTRGISRASVGSAPEGRTTGLDSNGLRTSSSAVVMAMRSDRVRGQVFLPSRGTQVPLGHVIPSRKWGDFPFRLSLVYRSSRQLRAMPPGIPHQRRRKLGRVIVHGWSDVTVVVERHAFGVAEAHLDDLWVDGCRVDSAGPRMGPAAIGRTKEPGAIGRTTAPAARRVAGSPSA